MVHLTSDWLLNMYRLMDILDMILQYCHKWRMSELNYH